MPYAARIIWKRGSNESFVDNNYSRAHVWRFDGGIEVPASSSPRVVPVPMSSHFAVDPEEAFVASIASCHMLWFLSVAAGRKFKVESYEDHAEGVLAKSEAGILAMTEVTLNPAVRFCSNILPSAAEVDELHRLAHERCYIANSVKTIIRIVQRQE